jgi:hypothetical protein
VTELFKSGADYFYMDDMPDDRVAARQSEAIQNDLNHCAYIHSDLQVLPFSIALMSTIRREDTQLIVALCINSKTSELGSKILLIMVIAVVINMFRLPDLLTGENVMYNRLKLLQT